MQINGVIHIPISDSEIDLVIYELLKKDVPEDYREQLEQELKHIKETHLISENRIKQFLNVISSTYSNDFDSITPFKILEKIQNDQTKPYHELLKQALEKTNYNEEQLQDMEKISSSYSATFERIRRRSRTGKTIDNSAELEEQIKHHFSYALELANLDRLMDNIMNYDSMITITNDIISEIEVHQLPLDDVKDACINFNKSFSTNFENIKEQIAKYNEFMQSYYKEHVSTVQSFQNGQDFNFIVHRVTGEFPDTLDFKTPYVSASLITDETMGLYGGFQEKGLIVDRKGFILAPSNIVSAQHKDTWTGNRESATDDLFYRQGYAILSPETIEQRCLSIANDINSDQLSENTQIYSEIVTDGFSPQAIFCITNGEGTLNPDYVEALKQAKKYGLPLVEINQREYRKKANLTPMTQIGEIVLVKEVLQKIMPDYIKNINDFDRLREEIMTDDICRRIASIFNQMSDQQTYNEEDFVKLASNIISEQIITNDAISQDRKLGMKQNVDNYFKTIEETDIIQKYVEVENQPKKQNKEQKIVLSNMSLEQLDELQRTGQVQQQIEQNVSNNIHLQKKGIDIMSLEFRSTKHMEGIEDTRERLYGSQTRMNPSQRQKEIEAARQSTLDLLAEIDSFDDEIMEYPKSDSQDKTEQDSIVEYIEVPQQPQVEQSMVQQDLKNLSLEQIEVREFTEKPTEQQAREEYEMARDRFTKLTAELNDDMISENNSKGNTR